MIIEIDGRSAVPPFEQLRSQIAALIEQGVLANDQQLPTVRQLAADLGLAPGTIARSYKELERAGLIESRGRHGTRVTSAAAAPPSARAKDKRLVDAARTFAEIGRTVGASERDMLQALRKALAH